jgi:hypothetical protein
MDTLKMTLLQKALNKYGKIFPCGTKNTFNECYTQFEDMILFWFDTEDHSTHIETAPLH